MKKELDDKLVGEFPLLYKDRNASMQVTAMCWGFACGDGWFDIIWDLSSKLEPVIKKYIKDNPNSAECVTCGCKKDRHYGSQTDNVGKCLAIHTDPDSEELPPGNYHACFCEKYDGHYPKAAQVKEKYGDLCFYMTLYTDEIRSLIRAAVKLSQKTCESCGNPGEESFKNGWVSTLCESCYEKSKDPK